MVVSYSDLRSILTKLRQLSMQTREFISGLNSTLFDTFWRSYGINSKTRRSELPSNPALLT